MAREDFLSFGWWNTGLCPPRRTADYTGGRREHARQVIQQLVDELDLLALGEVAAHEAEQLYTDCCSHTPHLLQREDEQSRGPRRNLAVLYNADKLQLIEEPRTLYDTKGRTRLHVGEHLLFSISPFPAHLHLFVVHWPSRRRPDSNTLRMMVGNNLHTRIQELLDQGSQAAHVMVLGDFNDEPFDQSLSGALLGSRDRDLVRQKPWHLYNPFWRLLGERQSLEEEAEGRLGAGTHYYDGTVTTRWHTFDQFLVSSSLLDSSGWILNEGLTRIWQNPPLLDSRGHFAAGFDHLPILGTLAHVVPAETSPGA